MTDLKSIGEKLKKQREEMDISLKEAENATSIRSNHLQAIEEGEIHKIPSPVYAQGFFKQYAAYLGLDGEQILKENPHLFQKPQKQEFSYGIGTLEVRGHPGSGVKWLPNLIWAITFIGVLVLAYFLADYLQLI